MADVTGPVGICVSSTGEFGGLGSLKDGVAMETERICTDGSTVRGCGAWREADEFALTAPAGGIRKLE
jgi:hypothetical protein